MMFEDLLSLALGRQKSIGADPQPMRNLVRINAAGLIYAS